MDGTTGEAVVHLFSYGTLRQENVQRALFGRRLEGRPDALVGFALEPLTITDAGVIATSGAAVHSIARRTGLATDLVPGMLFELTPAELAAADAYEVDVYGRVEAPLASGATAWVYVAGDG